MVDDHLLNKTADRIPPLPADDDWAVRWQERNVAVRSVLGETIPPGIVHSFSWRNHVLPGACCLTFRDGPSNESFLNMTLGMTQPLHRSARAYPWELSVTTREVAEWPVDLLYQLLTQWLSEKEAMGLGYHLPLTFFVGGDGKLWASISERVAHRQVVGDIRGVYLWADQLRRRFHVSTGEFGLLSAIPVTEDEDFLAQATTPAHLILLFRRLGIDHTCAPERRSVMTLPTASAEWAAIERLSHDDAIDQLDKVG